MLRNHNIPGLGRVLKNPVTPTLTHLKPTIIFESPNDLPGTHYAMVPSAKVSGHIPLAPAAPSPIELSR